MKAGINKKLIVILSSAGAVVLAGIILLIIFLTGGFTKLDLNLEGIEGLEQVDIDLENNVVTASVDSSTLTIDAMKLIHSQGAVLELFKDPECTQKVEQMDLVEGENIYYAKVSGDKKGKDKIWTIKITKAPAVAPLTVKSIALKSFNTHFALSTGFSNGTISVTMSDDSVKDVQITADMLTNFDTSTVGRKTITLTYEGITCTFDIIVYNPSDAKYITDVQLVSFKNSYVKDSGFLGGTIRVTYNDDSSELFQVSESMLLNFSTNKTGTRTATISFNGFTLSVNYNVNASATPINLYDYDEEMADIGALFMVRKFEKGDYDYYYNQLLEIVFNPDNEQSEIINSLSESLTLAGITDDQIRRIIALQKNKLIPLYDKLVDRDAMISGTFILDTIINKDALDDISEYFSEYKSIFDANDLANIALGIDVEVISGYGTKDDLIEGEIYFCANSLYYMATGLDFAATFREIDGDIQDAFDMFDLLDREELSNRFLVLYNLIDSFISYNKGEMASSIKMIYDIFWYGENNITVMYPIDEVLPSLHYLGDMLIAVRDAFPASYVLDPLSKLLYENVGENIFSDRAALTYDGYYKVIGFLGEVLKSLTLADISDFYDDFDNMKSSSSQDDFYADGARAVVRLCKILNDVWNDQTPNTQVAIRVYFDKYGAEMRNDADFGQSLIALMQDNASFDINAITPDDSQSIMEDFYDMMFGSFEGDEENHVNFDYNKDIIVRVGTAEQDVINHIITCGTPCYVVEGMSYAIEDNAKESISGIDTSSAGRKYFTLTSNGVSGEFPYYVIDDTTEVTYLEYKAYSRYTYIQKNSSLDSIAIVSAENRFAYFLPEYLCAGEFFFEITSSIVLNVENFVNVNTGTTGKFVGFYKVYDISLGYVYIPFTYIVYDPENIQIMAVSTCRNKTVYTIGEEFSANADIVRDDGNRTNISLGSEMTVTGYDKDNTLAEQTVTLTIGGLFSYERKVLVVEELNDNKVATKLRARQAENKIYLVNEIISKEDFYVDCEFAYYGFDDHVPLDDFTISYDTSVAGECEVTISAYGLSIIKKVTVITEEYSQTVTSVEVAGEHKNYYMVGDENNFNYGNARIIYGGGYQVLYFDTEEDMLADDKWSNDFSTETVGHKKMYFTYDGVKSKAGYLYYVYPAGSDTEIESIGTRLSSYTLDLGADLSGTIIVNYVLGDSEEINIKNPLVDISIYDNNSVGWKEVTISYGGDSTTTEIFVKDPVNDNKINRFANIYCNDTVFTLNEEVDLSKISATGYALCGDSNSYKPFSINLEGYLLDIEEIDTLELGVHSFKLDMASYFLNEGLGYVVEDGAEVEIFYTVR